MKRFYTLVQILLIPIFSSFAKTLDQFDTSASIPFSTLFYNIDSHLIGSFAYNSGLNNLFAVALSYGLVKSGTDWGWNKYANEKGIATAGFVSVAVGGLAPFVGPLGLYLYGRSHDDQKLQITGLALGQAALLAGVISSTIKGLTGRRPPAHNDTERGNTDFSNDFKFGILNRGAFEGWPSGHTMNVFAMAVTMIELYPENNTVKYSSLAFAAIVGLGVSTNIHWLSDVVAGGLIGYSIGRVVGAGYAGINGKANDAQSIMLYPYPGGLSVAYRF
jgi:membrane-associated phospholipid phosphatase